MPPWPDEALVGRDDLIGELAAAADGALHGTGSVVLLTGEAGIGKTSVAQALTRQVRDELAVSWGTCPVDRSAPPFWPRRALVTSEPPSPLVHPSPSTDPAIGAERFERLNELRDQLVERARDGPLLHVMEDLQWADVASVLLLVHLGTAIVDAPLLVVGTLRTREPLSPQLEDAIEEVRRSARVRQLQPLGDEDIVTLIRAAGVEPDDGLTALVRSRTGGNPLFVTELLRAARAADPAQRRLDALRQTVPSRVSELVTNRLARLPGAVSEVLVTASVVGAEGDARTLAAARGATVESVLDLLDQARAAHLLDVGAGGRWHFRHALIRDAVYASVPGTSRARHHASVLEALAADGSTPAPVLAHHALAAQPLFDSDRAVALAARAGESAASLAKTLMERARNPSRSCANFRGSRPKMSAISRWGRQPFERLREAAEAPRRLQVVLRRRPQREPLGSHGPADAVERRCHAHTFASASVQRDVSGRADRHSMSRRQRQLDELHGLCRSGALVRAIDLAFEHFAHFGPDDTIIKLLGDAADRAAAPVRVHDRLAELRATHH